MKERTSTDYAKIIARGRDAYQDYTLVEKKIAQLKEEILQTIAKTKISSKDADRERRNLVGALQIADRVLEYLLSDIREGQHAIEQLEEIKRVGKPTLLQRVMP